MGTAGARRRARGYALQILYGMDLNEVTAGAARADAEPNQGAVESAIRGFWASFQEEENDQGAIDFASGLARDAVIRGAEVDEIVQTASKNWRLERMSRVDRNILRLATAEMTSGSDVPVRVVINEAVELAKRFGAEESPAFVNGILDRIAQSVSGGP